MGRDDDVVASRTQSQADRRHQAGSKGVLYPGYLYGSSLAIRDQGNPIRYPIVIGNGKRYAVYTQVVMLNH